MDTETISGLLTQKPGRTPEPGHISTYTIEHKPAVNGKKAWIKVRFAPPEKGGQSYRIVNVSPTGFTDSYGNVSFNIELEKLEKVFQPSQGSPPPAGQATGTAQQTLSKDDYWSRKEARDIAQQPRIERQSARRDAIEFHKLECGKHGGVSLAPSLDRVKELMGILEGWLGEEAEW